MQLKTYSAESLRAALRLARVELGGDATLVGSQETNGDGATRYTATFAVHNERNPPASRPSSPSAGHRRTFVPPEAGPDEPILRRADGTGAAVAAAPAPAPLPAAAEGRAPERAAPERADAEGPALRAIVIQLRALHAAVDSLRRAEPPAGAGGSGLAPGSAPTAAQQALERLVNAGMDLETWPGLRRALQEEASAGRSSFELVEWLRRQISQRWLAAPTLGSGEGPAVAALVGPSGSGKTSSILKLAVQYGQRRAGGRT